MFLRIFESCCVITSFLVGLNTYRSSGFALSATFVMVMRCFCYVLVFRSKNVSLGTISQKLFLLVIQVSNFFYVVKNLIMDL